MVLLAADGERVSLIPVGDSSWGFPQQDSGRDDFSPRVSPPKTFLLRGACAPYALIRAVERFFPRNFPEPPSERAVHCQWYFDGE
jgi:hypothetical protein